MTIKYPTRPPSSSLGRRGLWLLILLLTFTLRVAGLAEHNFWWDEGIGVWLARMPVAESVRWTAGDVHPPLYYILQRGWYLLAGEGEFALRFSAVLCSFLTIPLIYHLGRALSRRDGVRIGLLAALFLTLSRFAITWAQEIRMYALAALLTTGVLWAALRLWQRNDARAWLAYVGLTLGSLYTLYLDVVAPAVANLGFLVAWLRAGRPRRMLAMWLTAQLAIAALFAPWLAYALPRMHSWASDSAFAPGFFMQLYATMLVVGAPLNLERYLPITAIVGAILAGGLVCVWRTRRTPAQEGALAMLGGGLVLPALVVLLVSLPAFQFYYARPIAPRYLLPLSACFYTLAAWGLGTLLARGRRWRIAAAAATIVVVLAAVWGLWGFYPGRVRRDDYMSIAQTLQAHRRPDDQVLLYVDRDWPVFTAYYSGARASVPYGLAWRDDVAVAAWIAPLWAAADGLWLVTTPESLQTDPQQLLPEWLAAQAAASHTFVQGETVLTFYARTAARAETFFELAPGFTPPQTSQTAFAAGGVLQGAQIALPRYRTGDTLRLALYWVSPPPAMQVWLVGSNSSWEIAVEEPPSSHDVTRQPIAIPLTPDLPGGSYRVLVTVSGESREIGRFTLVRSAAGAEISTADISHPLMYRLGETITLVGYDLPRAAVAPGAVVELTLYWQTQTPLSTRYKVFTHLLGETFNASSGNFLWGQQDNEPGGGQALTTLWTPGAIIEDTYRIPVASDAPPGAYTLEIGMYGLVDAARLPVVDANGRPSGDAILLTTVRVTTTD